MEEGLNMGNIVVEGIAAGGDTEERIGEGTEEGTGEDNRRGEAVGSLDS